jgi:hypothetical protein
MLIDLLCTALIHMREEYMAYAMEHGASTRREAIGRVNPFPSSYIH